jgi:hypothetical protein
MPAKQLHRTPIAKSLALFMAILSVMLFVGQPNQLLLKQDAQVVSIVKTGKTKQEKSESPQEVPAQSQVVKAEVSALIPVGSLAIAQIPAFPKLVPQPIEAPKLFRNEAPKGITVFLKTLFSRIITPNAP